MFSGDGLDLLATLGKHRSDLASNVSLRISNLTSNVYLYKGVLAGKVQLTYFTFNQIL